MQWTREQVTRMEHVLAVQRGNVVIDDVTSINAIPFVASNGRTWRALPERYGRWHTVYMRMRRWAKRGVLDEVFHELPVQDVIHVEIESLQRDSTSVEVHGGGTGKRKMGGSSHPPLTRRAQHQTSLGCHEPPRGSRPPPDARASA